MHILIIPGEDLNKDNQISSVFELNQALALRELEITVGFISTKLRGTIYKEIKSSIIKLRLPKLGKTKTSHQRIKGISLVESSRAYCTPSFLKLYRYEKVNCAIKAYKQYVRQFGKPDLIHAHSRFLDSGLIAKRINKLFGVPFIITEHSSFHLRDMVKGNEYKLYHEVVNASKKWQVVSESLGECIVNNFLLYNLQPNKQYSVMPNLIDPRLVNLVNLENSQKESVNGFTFLNIASLDENKNHELLIRSFAQLSNKLNDLELRIGGEGVLENQLKSLVKQLNLQKVTFLGRLSREQVAREIINSDTVVLSSNIETFGVVLIEAMALGKPVISTRSGGPNSIVEPSNGILVEPNNVQQLSEAMLEMIVNYNQYSSNELRANCIVKYGPKTIAKKLIEVYKEALN